MNLQKLNRKYYELFGELYTERALLGNRQYEIMYKTLVDQYKKDLDVVLTEKELKVGEGVFELKYRAANYLPHRRFLFFHNKMAKLLLKKYDSELNAALAQREQELEPQNNTEG